MDRLNGLDVREWLLTNGLGSFASGTVSDARTRIYHGWLIAAMAPPCQRRLLLSHLQASLEVEGRVWELGTNFWVGGVVAPMGSELLRSFEIEPVPTWIWGNEGWQLTRQLLMPHGLENIDSSEGKSSHALVTANRILINYRYQGATTARLRLRLLIGDRDFHHQQRAEPDLQFWQKLEGKRLLLQAMHGNHPGTPWQLRWSAGEYQADGYWYWNYYLPQENRRGLGEREDLYSPGEIIITLQPGESVTLEARVRVENELEADISDSQLDFEAAVYREQQRLDRLFGHLRGYEKGERASIWWQLLRAGDQFIVYRASVNSPSVIAGYHWFNDWGRDTLIALPGLALATGRFKLARGLLQTFGRYCREGLIPNTFPDVGTEPLYNSIDAALWWIEVLGLYLEATGDWDFLAEQYGVVRQIYKAFSAGTRYNIQVDATDGLLMWNAPYVALTWMDAVVDGYVVTPRRGKPVEINALWYSALCWATKWAERLAASAKEEAAKYYKQAQRYAEQAQRVKCSLSKFWNDYQGYLYDTIDVDDWCDPRIRPNAVLALSLHHCGFSQQQGRQVLKVACKKLLTPYGLRSLAPDCRDYLGTYAGDRFHRERAYHQGTVWSWLIGPFVRAWKRFYPEEAIPFDCQPLLTHFSQQACIGSISEIFDGDPPHAAEGAIAQAWSVAELIRHWPDLVGVTDNYSH